MTFWSFALSIALILIADGQQTIRKCEKAGLCKENDDLCREFSTPEEAGKIFPEDRPQCVKCSGEGCVSDEKATNVAPCVNYVKDDKCYAVVKDDKNAERGCASDPSKKLCEDNVDLCRECASKGCNKDTEITVKCHVCSGEKCQRPEKIEPDCKIDARVEECKATYGHEACYILREGNNVSRGCLKLLPPSADGEVEKCKGEQCNSKCFPDLECPRCESRGQPECLKDDYQKSKCAGFTSVCHWCEDPDGNAVRGCGNGNSTLVCNYGYADDKPAKKPKRTCFVCDGQDANCATLERNLTTKDCSKDDDECVVFIRDNKTFRGCLSEYFDNKTKCAAQGFCRSCSQHNCNGGVYPEDRRQCYQCSKTEQCKDVHEGKLKAMPCAQFEPTDRCYTVSKDGKDMVRGCWSDTNRECNQDDSKCAPCDANGCNKEPFSKGAELKCVNCKDKPDCTWAQDANAAELCKDKVEYWQKETCFTYQHNATVVSRGCTLESPACSKDAMKCQQCQGDGCNRQNLMSFTCYRCRSDNVDEERCSDTVQGLQSSKCTNLAGMDYKSRGCYTQKYGDVIIRGCLVDLDAQTRAKCLEKDSKVCHHCLGVDCNNEKPPNSSATKELSLLLLSLTALITRLK